MSSFLIDALWRAHQIASVAGASTCLFEASDAKVDLRVAFDDPRRCSLACDLEHASRLASISYGSAFFSDEPVTPAMEVTLCAITAVHDDLVVQDTIRLAGIRLARVTRLDVEGVPFTDTHGCPFADRLPGITTTRLQYLPWSTPHVPAGGGE